MTDRRAAHRARILVAEDNAVNQQIAALMLRKLGYAADTVANGLEVIEALERNPYDLVLMDCQMPEMDGYEATAAIRRRAGPVRTIPVIAMTAHALAGDREKCLAAGMNDYLAKPMTEEQLQAALARWFLDPNPTVAEARPDSQALARAPLHQAGLGVAPASVDATSLKRLKELAETMDPSFLARVADAFVAGAVERISALRLAAARGDAKALRDEAHALKGAGLNVGARPLAGICQQICDRSAGSAGESVADLLDQLESEFGQVKHRFEEEIPAGSPAKPDLR